MKLRERQHQTYEFHDEVLRTFFGCPTCHTLPCGCDLERARIYIDGKGMKAPKLNVYTNKDKFQLIVYKHHWMTKDMKGKGKGKKKKGY